MIEQDKMNLGSCGWAHIALANGKFARPGSKPSYAPDQNFDVQHISLELDIDIPRKTVQGKCTTTLRAMNDGAKVIHFDAVQMKILSVLSLGKKLKTSYNGEKLTVHLAKAVKEEERVAMTIHYILSNPVAGIYFIGPDASYPKKPVQVWTHGEAEESRYWFPCFDAPHDKSTTEMAVTVPRDFFALSNGALIHVKENRKQKTKTYHWKQAIPHSPYLVTLVAGRFSEIKEEWDGIPILYYCQPGREADAKRAFGKTPKMIRFFSEAIGVRYPFEKYAQIAVADFVMGGMEHTTATTLTDRVLMDERAYPEFTADWLVSHELAHQWFGDLLTCKEWSHAWLNESFATYFEALFTEFDLGKDEFLYEMWNKAKLYFEEDRKVYRRAIVTNVYRHPDDLFDRHLYEKGSLVLHMLRSVLGDALFWKAIRRYVKTYSGKAVETNDFINAIQESTGKNMRKFFDAWVFGAGHPEYTVNYWWDEAGKTVHLRVLQKSGGSSPLFSIPVAIEFLTSKGKKRYQEVIEEQKHEFRYRFSKQPLDVRFDPERSLLKAAEIVKPYPMWIRQLESDPHVIGRICAAKEIAKIATEESLKILMRALSKEKFWGAAKEIAASIGAMRLENGRKFLVRSLKIKNPKARRGIAEALSQFQDEETLSKLERSFEKDPSYFVCVESLNSLVKSRSPLAMRSIKKALNKNSWNDVIRASAVASLSQIPIDATVQLMKKFCRYGFHPACRTAAVQAMSKCARSFPELFSELVSLTADRQLRVKHTAISALGELKDPRAVPALEKISKNKQLPHRTRALAEDALLKINPAPFLNKIS